MFGDFSDAEWVGLSLVFLGMAMVAAMYVRRHLHVLAATHIPASVIAGFLLLLLGPQVLGRWLGGDGIVPQEIIDVLAPARPADQRRVRRHHDRQDPAVAEEHLDRVGAARDPRQCLLRSA